MEKKTRLYIWLTVYVFCLIYAPPIFYNFNFLWLQSIVTGLIIIARYRKKFIEIVFGRYIRRFYGIFLCAVAYIFVRIILGYLFAPVNLMNYVMSLYRLFLVVVPVTICVVYIIIIAEIHQLSLTDLLSVCVYAGMIQASITVLTLLSPTIKYQLTTIVLRNTVNKTVNDIPTWEYSRRYYAFSDCMSDMIGIGSGILTAISFYLGCVKSSRYYFYTPILFLVPLFNAVTGIVVTAIMILFLIPVLFKKLFGNRLIAVIAICMVCMSGAVILVAQKPEAINWVSREINALIHLPKAILENAGGSSVKNMFSKSFWEFPQNEFSMLFGTGHTVYQAQGFAHSDIGYTNMIWLAGICGCLLLYGAFMYLFYSTCKCCRKTYYFNLILGLWISFFAFECKGIGITYQPGIPLFLLLAFSCLRIETHEKPCNCGERVWN